jgi:hypothetical protein
MSVDELTDLATFSDEPRRSRRVFIAVLTVAVLAAVIVLLVLAQGQSRPLAQLRVRETSVEVRSGDSSFRPGVEGQALAFGDTIRTDATGQAQVDYFDGSLTRLDADTTFVIRELQQGAGTKQITVRQDAGRTWNRVEKLTSSQDRFELHGVTSVASVRGTTWVLDSRLAPVEFALVVAGQIQVTVANVGTATVLAGECVRMEPDSIRPCTEEEEARIKDDWFFLNYYYEGRNADLTPPGTTPTASPTRTPPEAGGSGPVLRRGTEAGSPTTPSPTPQRTRKPSIDEHDDDETRDRNEDEETDPPTEPPGTPTPSTST